MEKHKRLCVPKGIGAKQGGQNDTICSYFHFRPDPDIYCGRIHGTPEDFGGTGVAIRAPVQITIQGTNIHSGNQAVLLDHPDADLVVLGGNHMSNMVSIRQLRGHFNLWGPGCVGGGRGGADIEINTAADDPFVICGIRTEGHESGHSTQFLVRTAETGEPIDVIMKANSISDARPVEYRAAGTLTMVGNDAIRGGLRVPAGSGQIWSVANIFGMFSEPLHAPYTINPDDDCQGRPECAPTCIRGRGRCDVCRG